MKTNLKRMVSMLMALWTALCCLSAANAEASTLTFTESASALATASTLDGQLELLDRIANDFAAELESGGWDVSLNVPPAEALPDNLLPDDAAFAQAIDADGLPDELRGLKFIVLYDDGGTMRLLGDFTARLPEIMRASSLEEADGVLLLRHYMVDRTDYVGSAFDRHYDLCAYPIGADSITRLFHTYTIPPVMGSGTLTGAIIEMQSLWNSTRGLFNDSITVQDAYGALTFRVTGEGCYLEAVEGDRVVLDIPEDVNGYPVLGLADCNLIGNCPSLETVNFPNGLVWIGDRAFFLCSSLREVNLSET